MSDEVSLNPSGYTIGQADIDRVTNPFLDLDESLGQIFYFLEGHYDQIILEKIYSILTAELPENKKQMEDLLLTMTIDKADYDQCLKAYNDLYDLGLYEIQDLWAAMAGEGGAVINQDPACKVAINETKNKIFNLIYDLCKYEIDKIDPDLLNISFEGDSFDSLAAALQATPLTSNAATWTAAQIEDVLESLAGMKDVVDGPIAAFDKSLSDQMNLLIQPISAARAAVGKEIENTYFINKGYYNHELAVIDEFLASASAETIDMNELNSKLSRAIMALNDMSTGLQVGSHLRLKRLVENMEEDILDFRVFLTIRNNIADYKSNSSASNLSDIFDLGSSYSMIQRKWKIESLPGYAELSSSINFYLDNSGTFAAATLLLLANQGTTLTEDAITILRAIENLVTSAISEFTSSPTDENLNKVKCALRAIKDFPGASNISPSITDAIEVIEDYFQDKILLQNAKIAIAAFNNATTPETFVDSMAEAFRALRDMANDDSIRSLLADANTSNILEKIIAASELMGNINATIDDFTSLESFIGANDRFDAVQNTFKDAIRVLLEQFVGSGLEDLPNRSSEVRNSIANVNTFDSFYSNIDRLIEIFQTPAVAASGNNPAHPSVKSYLYPSGNEPTNLYVTNSCNLAEPLTWAELTTLCTNQALRNTLDTVTNNVVGSQATYNGSKKEYNDLMTRLNIDPNMSSDDLLNLCMMASTPAPQADGSYRLVTGIVRTKDANGNYTYELQYGSASLSKATYDASFSKEDGYAHYSLPYFALAIMYEKVGIQQLILVEQLKQIEKINEEIKTNNSMLKCLNWLYDKVYGKAASQGGPYWPEFKGDDSETNTSISITELHTYLKDTVKSNGFTGGDTYSVDTSASGGKGIFKCAIAQYNRDGDTSGGETQNIDVKEQATLTMISNQQDNTRIYGDKLSTDSQLMTTKMSQYMQNSNACVSACSQVVKSIGDYFKTIASNIR